MLLDREQFLRRRAEVAAPFEDVPVPEFGPGCVQRVLGLSMTDRTRWEMKVYTGRSGDRKVNARIIRETLLVATLVDETNAPMFTEADGPMLGELPATVGERLFDAARRVSGMTEQDVEALGNA
mgnify:FL=1